MSCAFFFFLRNRVNKVIIILSGFIYFDVLYFCHLTRFYFSIYNIIQVKDVKTHIYLSPCSSFVINKTYSLFIAKIYIYFLTSKFFPYFLDNHIIFYFSPPSSSCLLIVRNNHLTKYQVLSDPSQMARHQPLPD